MSGKLEGYETSSLHEGNSSESLSWRTSVNSWCDEECYRDPVSLAVQARISKLTGIPQSHGEYLQMLKYVVPQYYKVCIHVLPPIPTSFESISCSGLLQPSRFYSRIRTLATSNMYSLRRLNVIYIYIYIYIVYYAVLIVILCGVENCNF